MPAKPKPAQLLTLEQSKPRAIVGWFSLSVEECEQGSASWVQTYLRDKAEQAVQEVLEKASEREWLDV